jgi:exopolysaccharide production protein ExoF
MSVRRLGLYGITFICLALSPIPSYGQATVDEIAQAGAQNQGRDPAHVLVTDAQKIALRFSDIPRLNGDYRVNADETVTVPGLGRVSVASMTAPQLERTLAEMATGLAGREIYATVEVSEYRPVFVSGRVARYGPVPWEPGLTVQQAVATVGGIAQDQSEDAVIQRKKARIDQQRLMATMARLRAEQEGTEDVGIPEALSKSAGRESAERLIHMQSVILQNRRSALQKQLELLNRGKALATEELESLRVQKSKIAEQLEARRKQRDRIQALLDQKLTVVDRALEESIKVSDLEEKIANISVAIARVQSTISGFDREALNATELRKSEVDTELANVERELAQLGPVLDTAEPGASSQASSVGYTISRRKGKNVQVLAANPGSPLMPGDVLTVGDEQTAR